MLNDNPGLIYNANNNILCMIIGYPQGIWEINERNTLDILLVWYSGYSLKCFNRPRPG